MSSIIPNQSPNKFHVFTFQGHEFTIITDDDGNLWFAGNQVAQALEIVDIRQAIERLDDDEKRRYSVPTGGGIQSVVCISEAGLYSLVLSSRKPAAKDFKRWLTHDVLPAIRKTGSYITSNLTPLQILRQMLDTFEAQNERIDNLDNRVELLEAHVQPELEYFTITGYCHKRKLTVSTNQAISLGQKAKRLSVERNVPVGKIADPRYGEVNTYHVSILDEVIGSS